MKKKETSIAARLSIPIKAKAFHAKQRQKWS